MEAIAVSTETCPISKERVDVHTYGPPPLAVEYTTVKFGKVRFGRIAWAKIHGEPAKYDLNVIGGIIKNWNSKNEEPLKIINEDLDSKFIKYRYPATFQDKAEYLLQYIYDEGAKEYKTFDFNSTKDHFIAYADEDEFNRIIKMLKSKKYIDYEKAENLSSKSGRIYYKGVYLTEEGIEQINSKDQFKPLFSLNPNKISTGDAEIDKKLVYAIELFQKSENRINNKRSACETLSHILEPLRTDLEKYFNKADIQIFFQFVNKFDIRHNKLETEKIKIEEQLDWIFYSLLNTINIYFKIKTKYNTSQPSLSSAE